MIISRTLRRLSDRSSVLAAATLRRAADAAHRVADRLAPADEPADEPAPTLTLDDVAQAVASTMPLPAPPHPTGDVAIDIANLVTYQAALAEHAKRDEMLRTFGALAGRLVR